MKFGSDLRWLIVGSFLCFGVHYLGSAASFDAERIMPLVVGTCLSETPDCSWLFSWRL